MSAGHGGARLLDVHVGQVVERLFLDAQVLELLGPGHRIVGIALAGGTCESEGSEGDGEGDGRNAHGIFCDERMESFSLLSGDRTRELNGTDRPEKQTAGPLRGSRPFVFDGTGA